MKACFRHRIENKMIIRTLSHNSDFVLVIVNCEFTSQNCLSQKKKSRNYLSKCFILWRKQASMLYGEEE